MTDRFRTGLDWDDVRVFLAVTRAGTLSGAARTLRVNHATVARRLASLEANLGAPLFEKTAAGYVATPAGRGALPEAEAMEAAATSLARRAETGEAISGRVRVSALATHIEYLLTPGLAALIEAHRGLELELAGEDRLISLARGEADIALRPIRPASGDAVARRIGDLGWRYYAANGYGAATRPEEWRFVAYTEEVEEISPTARGLREIVGSRRIALRCSTIGAQFQAALAGAGVALLPCYLADPHPGLDRVAPKGELDWSQQLWLVVRSDVRRIARVRLVADAIADLVKTQGEALAGVVSDSR